jgi:hypothetical protein
MIKNQIKQRKAEEAAAAADEEGWGGDEEEESDADDDDVQLIDPGVGRSEISHRSRARDDVEEGEEEEESQMPARRGNKARESRAARMAQLLDESSSSDQDQSGGTWVGCRRWGLRECTVHLQRPLCVYCIPFVLRVSCIVHRVSGLRLSQHSRRDMPIWRRWH